MNARSAPLTLAACIGYRFDLKTLARVADRPRREVAGELSAALREGLILAAGADSRFFDAALSGAMTGEAGRAGARARRLLPVLARPRPASGLPALRRAPQAGDPPPDRAAPARGQRPRRHGGRGLRGRDPHEPRRMPRITDPEERVTLARLNLEAGRRAQGRRPAYEAAASYFEAGTSAIGPIAGASSTISPSR